MTSFYKLGQPEPNEYSPSDVLDGPEVEGEEESDRDEAADETVGNEVAEQVN